MAPNDDHSWSSWPASAFVWASACVVATVVWALAWVVAAVTVACACVCAAAWLASVSSPPGVEIQGLVWGVAFLISTVSIVCGTTLAWILLGPGSRAERATGQANPTPKPPAFDPEAFEVAGHRG